MMRARTILGMALAWPASALAGPSWKAAPGGDKKGAEGSGFSFDTGDGDFMAQIEPLIALLTQYYGYFGVAFVVLLLILFGRGSKKPKRRREAQEDYYDLGDELELDQR